jgi:hypothetical protein
VALGAGVRVAQGITAPVFAAPGALSSKLTFVPLTASGTKAVKLHLRYIERDGVEKDGAKGALYDASGPARRETFEEPRVGEKHQFRVIVSPEDAGELDLTAYVRALMGHPAPEDRVDLDSLSQFARVSVVDEKGEAKGADPRPNRKGGHSGDSFAASIDRPLIAPGAHGRRRAIPGYPSWSLRAETAARSWPSMGRMLGGVVGSFIAVWQPAASVCPLALAGALAFQGTSPAGSRGGRARGHSRSAPHQPFRTAPCK